MVVYTVVMASLGLRNLAQIPPRYAAAVLEFIYAVLSENPGRVGKPLKRELEGLHGARRGDYRVLYEIRDDDKSVLVVRIDHRAQVYRSR